MTLGARQVYSLIVSFLNGIFLSCKISILTSAAFGLRRYASVVAYMPLSCVCPSVCHMPALSQPG